MCLRRINLCEGKPREKIRIRQLDTIRNNQHSLCSPKAWRVCLVAPLTWSSTLQQAREVISSRPCHKWISMNPWSSCKCTWQVKGRGRQWSTSRWEGWRKRMLYRKAATGCFVKRNIHWANIAWLTGLESFWRSGSQTNTRLPEEGGSVFPGSCLHLLCCLNKHMQVRCKGDKLTLKRKLIVTTQLIILILTWGVVCHFSCATSDQMRFPELQKQLPNTVWDITLYSLLKVGWCFRGIYRLHLPLKHRLTSSGLHVVLSQILLFVPTTMRISDKLEVIYVFLQNVGWLSADYTALYPRR
jgi:hypothetical protein